MLRMVEINIQKNAHVIRRDLCTCIPVNKLSHSLVAWYGDKIQYIEPLPLNFALSFWMIHAFSKSECDNRFMSLKIHEQGTIWIVNWYNNLNK